MESSEEFALGQTVQIPGSAIRVSDHVWTDEEISIIVDIRVYLNGHFEKGRLSSEKIWESILENMTNAIDSCQNLTVRECIDKWNELVCTYYRNRYSKKSLELQQKWEYYERIHSIFKDNPEPPEYLGITVNESPESLKLSDISATSNEISISTLELKKYKLKYAYIMWQRKKWKEKKQLLKQQCEMLQDMNSGIQDLVGFIKNS